MKQAGEFVQTRPSSIMQTIRFPCTNPACGNVLTVAARLAGLTGNCPRCGEALVVPQPSGNEGPAGGGVEDADFDALNEGDGRIVRFGAIGLAWSMLTARLWTWIFASLTVA